MLRIYKDWFLLEQMENPSLGSAIAVGQIVRDVIRKFAEGIDLPEPLPDDLLLMEDGLGFDSIRVVELLFVCEEELGVTITTEITENFVFDIGSVVKLIKRAMGKS